MYLNRKINLRDIKYKGGINLELIGNIGKRIKNIYEDIHKMTKVSELIEYIPSQSIEKVALVLLILWIMSPIAVMLCGLSQDTNEPTLLFKQYPVSIYWYQILQTIGFLGCILSIIVFSKSILEAKTKKLLVK